MAEVIDLEKFARDACLADHKDDPDATWSMDTTAFTGEVQSFKYDKVPITKVPQTLATYVYLNDTSVPATETLSESKSSQASATWTIQKTKRFGGSISSNIKIPFLAQAQVTATMEFTTQTTESQTKSVTQTWGVNINVQVPPHSKVVVDVIMQEATFSPHFTANIQYRGLLVYKAAVPGKWSNEGSDGLGVFFRTHPHPAVHVLDDQTIETTIEGTFQGVEGISRTVEAHEYALRGGKLFNVLQLEVARRFALTDEEALAGAIQTSDDDTIGAPDGVEYRVVSTREERRLTSICGFSDLGLANPGIYRIETREYKEWNKGTLIRQWIEYVDVFDHCEPV